MAKRESRLKIPDSGVPAIPLNREQRRHPDPLLTVTAAGKKMGTGERFIRRLVAERRIRYVKIGRHVRIPESAVEELIEAGTVEAAR